MLTELIMPIMLFNIPASALIFFLLILNPCSSSFFLFPVSQLDITLGLTPTIEQQRENLINQEYNYLAKMFIRPSLLL